MNVWVDDIRQPPDSSWVWVKTCRDALAVIRYNEVEKMSLDHDLGNGHDTRPIVMWMCENDIWPDEVYVHTANPPGREWLEGMIERYKP